MIFLPKCQILILFDNKKIHNPIDLKLFNFKIKSSMIFVYFYNIYCPTKFYLSNIMALKYCQESFFSLQKVPFFKFSLRRLSGWDLLFFEKK